MNNKIDIDGSFGEGGGQVLRSSLSLSMITGIPFEMKNIRAGRKKPGLMRQHLTCVRAAAELCDAEISGAELGSQDVTFVPKKLKGGAYHFAIGTAGSTMLLAQTLIPALIFAEEKSSLVLEGGTHNKHAPTYDFIEHSYLPVLREMGAGVDGDIQKYGFYPAGGGQVSFEIKPVRHLMPLDIVERGADKGKLAQAIVANIPYDVAERELNIVATRLDIDADALQARDIRRSHSAGNVLSIFLRYANVTETIIAFGEHGVKAEKVAKHACNAALQYVASGAAVGEHLADQLLLPFALAGGGRFTTVKPSRHTITNIEVVQKFLPCRIKCDQQEDGIWMISVR